jgi:hypothetical protein
MKKLSIVLALVITAGALFTSCSSKGHACPAYGKVNTVPAAHRS